MMTIVADELIVHRLTAKNTLRREDYIRQVCSNPVRAGHEHELKHARLLPQVPRYEVPDITIFSRRPGRLILSLVP